MNEKTAFPDYLAKTIRIITIPAILVTVLIVTLYFTEPYIFTSYVDAVLAVVFLGIFPMLAYPFQYCIPKLKEKGRACQRKLAFIFSLLGYTAGFIYGFAARVSAELLFVFITYFVSVIILTFVNKVIKVKASGHACSITSPCLFIAMFCGWYYIFPCLIVAAASVWASLYLKRHTAKELLSGSLVCMVSFVIALLFYLFLIR